MSNSPGEKGREERKEGEKISDLVKVMLLEAERGRWEREMLWERFWREREMARGVMSTPRVWLVDGRREAIKRGMQPVPAQRSRILRGEDEKGRRVVRWVIMDSVSGRGMRTDGLQRISRGPKGWLPRMYCNGIPFSRLRQACHILSFRGTRESVELTCSFIQRSSLAVESRVRQTGRSRGAKGDICFRACRNRDGASRGILILGVLVR